MWADKHVFHTVPIVFILHLPEMSVFTVQVGGRNSQGDNRRFRQPTEGELDPLLSWGSKQENWILKEEKKVLNMLEFKTAIFGVESQ